MAIRPVFTPVLSDRPGVVVEPVDFPWHAGLSPEQKRRNVVELHAAWLRRRRFVVPLEVSSKSTQAVGVSLGAFRLGVDSRKAGGFVCVESLYQGSKVFAHAGPFPEVLRLDAVRARALVREAGGEAPLVAFELHGQRWPLTPRRAFYDWLYLHALHANPQLVAALEGYGCFTDIEFNPARSVNCQAYAVALYVSLRACDRLDAALRDPAAFRRLHPADETPGRPADGEPAARTPMPSAASARRKPRPSRRPVRRTLPAPTAVPGSLPLFDAAFPQDPEPSE